VQGLSELYPGIFRFEVDGVIRVNSGLVVGDDAVCVIDSGTVASDAEAILAAARHVSTAPVRYVINTHHHGDHAFGNWWFRPAVTLGHTRCRLQLIGDAGESHREAIARLAPMAAEQIRAVPLSPPRVVFERSCRIRIGEMTLRLQYLGRAHTDNDVVTSVTCADGETRAHFAGDLVEEAGPPVAFDGFPAEWGGTLRRLAQLPPAPFVPGHGRPVGRTFVEEQALAFEQLAEVCRNAGQDNPGADATTTRSAALAAISERTRAVLGTQTAVAVARYYQMA
jgi:glyoxylase-like metal-dependent hydrolase (beta-lactamase superfamily II)